jgi:predicted nucleic acid-binding protein
MPDVVSNTTPLQYLHQIGRLDLLPYIYRRVVVPQAVADELRQGELKGIDVPVLSRLGWVTVLPVAAPDLQQVSAALDAGEREALALAIGQRDPLLLLDDAAARREAKSLGLRFTGTLGVLVRAKHAGHITTVAPCLDQLDNAGFYLRPDVRVLVLRQAGESP